MEKWNEMSRIFFFFLKYEVLGMLLPLLLIENLNITFKHDITLQSNKCHNHKSYDIQYSLIRCILHKSSNSERFLQLESGGYVLSPHGNAFPCLTL